MVMNAQDFGIYANAAKGQSFSLNDGPGDRYKMFYTSKGSSLHSVYETKLKEDLPRLLGEGRVLMSASDLMRRRLEVLCSEGNEQVQDAWWQNSFYAGDAVITHPDDGIKIVLDFEFSKNFDRDKVSTYRMILDEGVWDSLEGLHIQSDWGHYMNEYSIMSMQDAKKDPVLRFLARDDVLLERYIETISEIRDNVDWRTPIKSSCDMGAPYLLEAVLPIARGPELSMLVMGSIGSRIVEVKSVNSDSWLNSKYLNDPRLLVGVLPKETEAGIPVAKPSEENINGVTGRYSKPWGGQLN